MATHFSVKHYTVHEAICDCLARLLQGIDDADEGLLASALTPDSMFDITPMKQQGLGGQYGEIHGREQIIKALLAGPGKMDSSHTYSNARTRISDDGTTAQLTAFALAQHWRPGHGLSHLLDKDYFMCNRYNCELVLDGSEWRFTRFELKAQWAKGDRGVMDLSSWQADADLINKSLVK